MTAITASQFMDPPRIAIADDRWLRVSIRFDDSCKNGHNTFSITGEAGDIKDGRHCPPDSFGCLHDDIAQTKYAPLIKWHLVSTDGPMHYIANTTHLASNRDCWGRAAGEPSATRRVVVFGDNPITHSPGSNNEFVKWLAENGQDTGSGVYDFEVIQLDSDKPETFSPKFTFGGFGDKWHTGPFDTYDQAHDFLFALQNCDPHFETEVLTVSSGKAPELDAARNTAIWPDATQEQLTDPVALAEHWLAIRPEFRTAIESLGFTW